MSSQPSLIIRIGADATGATQTIHQVTNQIGALGSQTNNTTNRINHYNNAINQTANNSHNAANATQSLHSAMSGLQGVVGGIVSAFSLFKMREMIDDWAKLEGRIKLVSNSMQEVRDVQAGISEIAQRTRSDLQSTTELYARLAQAMEGTGKASKELLQLTETTNKAMIISGATAVEAKNALIQFGQALGSNRLGGDELRSMAEQAPRLVRAIRENLEGLTGGIGVTQAEFKKLAEDSYLTTERVTDALKRAKGQLDKEFEFMPTTIGQAFTGLNNKLFEFIGAGSQANGVGRAIASTIQMITDSFDGVISGLTIVAGGFLGYRTAVMLATAATEGFAIISAALNPAVWVGAAIAAVIAFRDEMVQIGNKTASIEAIVKTAWNNIQTSFANAWEAMKEIAANSVNFISTKIDALKAKFQWLISVNDAIQKMADYTPTGMVTNWLFNDKHKQDAQNFITDIGKTANGTLAEFAAQAEREQKKMTDARNAQKSKDDAEMAAYKKTPEQQAAELAAKKAQEAAKKLRDFNSETGSEMQKALAKEQELLEEWQSKLGKLTDEQKQQIHNTAFSGLNKQHAAEAKKAQSELNKEQEHYKKLIESTPIGEYNAKVADLKNALQKGGIDQQTYNDLMQEAAQKYEKATVGIEKMTQAEKERQRVFEQTSRGKFEKQMDELRAQKDFMSPTEYSAKQDKANVDYLKDSGLNPKAQTQIEAATDATKKFDDAIKEMNQSLYETDNTGKMAFDGLLGGISAVAGAFDGLGDALAKHDKHFAESSEKYAKAMLAEGVTLEQRTELTKAYHSEKEKYETASNAATLSGIRQIMGASSKMFSEQSAARKTFHAIEVALSVVEIAMSIKKTAVKLAEGASTMFAQSGWAGFAGVGMMVAVMAGLGFASSGGSSGKMPEYTKTTGTVLGNSEAQSESIKTITDKLDEIHAREYPQLRAIAVGMSDLKASISGLMISVFRAGGIKLADANSIGTVNNDKSMQMGALGVGVALTQGVLAGVGVSSAVSAIAGSATGLAMGVALGAATAGIGLLVSAAVYALSKVPVIGDIISGISNFIGNGLFGKVTQKVVGGGVQIQQQSLGSIMDSGDIDAQVATEIERKKKSWFKTSTKIIEVLSDLDKNISTGIAKVFTNMGSSVLNYWNYITGGFDKGKIIGGDMAAGLEKLRSFMIPFSNIKTFGLKDEEIQKAFDSYSSMTFDKMVQHVFGGFIAQFQKMGETMAEAMNRIVTEAAQTRTAFRNMGVDFDSSNEHLVIFTQSLSNMAGGIKNLTALVDNFSSKFTPNEVKQQVSKQDLNAFISDPKNIDVLNSQGQGATITAIQNLLNASGNATITAADISALQKGIYDSVTSLTKSTEKLSIANDSYQTVAATQAADNAFVHQNNGVSKTEQAWVDYLVAGHSAWKELTTATTTEQARAMATAAGVNADILLNYANGALKEMFAENSKVAADGLAKLASMNLETAGKAEFELAAAAEYAKAQPAQEVLLQALSVANAASEIIKGLSDYTKIIEKTNQLDYTAGKNTDIKRANETAALGTDLEKSANDAYYNKFDQKKFEDERLASERRIFDLQATNAQKSVENLNRGIQKIQEEATEIDIANGYMDARIQLLKDETKAQQDSDFNKKRTDLENGLFDATASVAEKSAKALNDAAQNLRDNYDIAGSSNSVQTLIDLLVKTETAKTTTKFNQDATEIEQRIFDLRATEGQKAVESLNRKIEAVKKEATAIDNANGYTQKRIDLLTQEFSLGQISAYKNKLTELSATITSIGQTDAQLTLDNLKKGIQDLRDNYVEIKDASGNVVNPLQTLIDLFIDSATAQSIYKTTEALKAFQQSAQTTISSIFALANTPAQTATYQLQVDSDKLNTESSEIEKLNGFTQKRIKLLRLEYEATQLNSYQNKFSDLTDSLAQIGKTDSEKSLLDLNKNIAELKANFVEIKDAAGNVINPIQALIDLLIDTQVAQNLEQAKQALAQFKTDAQNSTAAIFDAMSTPAQIAAEKLRRDAEKLTEQSTELDKLNGFTQKRIELLRLEYEATQLSNYDKKLIELKNTLSDIGASESDKIIAKLNADIADIKANFVELSDSVSGAQNPLQTLIDLLIDTQVADSLQKNIDSLKGFKTSIANWLDGMKVKEVGNAKTQFEAAKSQFDEKYKIITDTSGAYSNTQKTEAMQSITGSADTLVEKIRKLGANGDWAQAEVKALMSKMEVLPETASLEVLTLNEFKTANGYLQTIAENSTLNLQDSQTALQEIKDRAKTITPVLTDGVKTDLSDSAKTAATPSELKYDTLDKVKTDNNYGTATFSIQDLTAALQAIVTDAKTAATPGKLKIETFDALKSENGYQGAIPVNDEAAKVGENTTAMSLKEALDAGEKIGYVAINTKTTADNLDLLQASQLAFTEQISNVTSELNTATASLIDASTTPAKPVEIPEIEIKPISLSLETTGITNILNEQLIELRNIYAVLSKGIKTESANDSVPETEAPKPVEIPLEVEKPNETPVAPQQKEPFFSAPNTPSRTGAADYWADNPTPESIGLNAILEKNNLLNGDSHYVYEEDNAIEEIMAKAPSLSKEEATKMMSSGIKTYFSNNAPKKPFFSSGDGSVTTPVYHSATNGNGLFQSQAENDFYRTYGEANQAARVDPSLPTSTADLAALWQAGNTTKIADEVKNASNANYFTDSQKSFLNELKTKADAGLISIGANTYDAITDAKRVKLFAKGGISNEPAIFGEAGWEAAVPLPDGRTIPVTVSQAPFPEIDFSNLENILVDGFGELIERIEKLEKAVTGEQRKTTNATAQTGEKIYIAQKARTLN